jgi:hypothetical protein
MNKADLSPMELTKHRWFNCFYWFLLGVTALNFGINGFWKAIFNMNIDFHVYYGWANHIRAGYPYLLNIANAHHPSFYYPPFWGWLLEPFTWFDYSIAKQIWLGFNIILLVLGGLMFRDWAKRRPLWKEHWYRYGFLIIALNFTPFIESFYHGQANLLILILLAGSFWFYERQKPAISGILLGLSIMIKILPLAFLVYWAWKRQWRLLSSALATLLVLSLFSLGVIGLQPHIKFIQDTQIYIHYTKTHWMHQGNISLYSFLMETQHQGYLPQGLPVYPLCLLVAAGICVLLACKVPRNIMGLRKTAVEYSLGIISLFLATTYAEHHQFLLILMAYAVAWIWMDEITDIKVWLLLLAAWLLILMGFQMDDLDMTFGNVFWGLYFHTYGLLLAWLGMFFWLIQKDKSS